VNFAVLPLTFIDSGDYTAIAQGDVLAIDEPAEQLRRASTSGREPDQGRDVRHCATASLPARSRSWPGQLIQVIRDRERA